MGLSLSQDEYRYNNSWKDQLTYFYNEIEGCDCNSQNDNIRAINPGLLCLCKGISYDKSGNPTAYRGNAFVWARGRLLTKATLKDGRVVTMSYDAQGRRRSRSKGAIYHNYTYDQDRLLQLDTNFGGDPATLTFIYDSQGVQGFTYNNRVYHYVKNLFGDVTDIYCGSTRIVHYIYDALGNYKLSHTFDDLSRIGNGLIGDVNPFKYRSQLYDEDLGFYYIQGRYYDPATGRFISPARVSSLNPQAINGLNLYSYAGNNPLHYSLNTTTNTIEQPARISVNSNTNTNSVVGQYYTSTSNSFFQLDIPQIPKWLGYTTDIIDFGSTLKDIYQAASYTARWGVLDDLLSGSTKSIPVLGLILVAADTLLDVQYSLQDGQSVEYTLKSGAYTLTTGLSIFLLTTKIGTTVGGVWGCIIGMGVGLILSFITERIKEDVIT